MSRLRPRTLLLLLSALGLGACNIPADGGRPSGHVEEHVDPGVQQITNALTGAFSSTAQAAADSANYFDIHLRAVRIWTDRDDGPWLYVEQAAADALDRPYRQRVYHITFVRGGRYASEVYTLPGDPLRFAGAWQQDEPLAGLTPDSLALREGCAVYLERTGPGTYAGSTGGAACTSDLRGASYATSEVTLDGQTITSWDRGFAADSTQVWGATEGPYVFERIGD